mgnify:CR=1 FL=1
MKERKVKKKSRWSFSSARKERQKYTSDEYRLSYDQIVWDDKSKKKGEKDNGT